MQPTTTALNSSNVNLTGKEADDSSENDVKRYIWIIGGTLLLVVGTIGNFLALAVLCRRKMRRQKASVYLLVVALTDLAVLYSGLLRHVILEAFRLDVRKHSEWSCRVHMTLVYFFLDFSAWVLALLSVERLLSVLWPMVIRNHCTRLASVVAMVIVGVVLFALNSPFLFLVGDGTHTRGNYSITWSCLPLSKENSHFVFKVWPWIDMTVFSLLPLLIHIVCNVLIVQGVTRSLQRFGKTEGSRNFRSDRKPPLHSERNRVQRNGIVTENGCGCFRELSAPVSNREFCDTLHRDFRDIPVYDGIGGSILDSSTGFQTTEYNDPQSGIFVIASGNSAAADGRSNVSAVQVNGISTKPLGIVPPMQSDTFGTGQCSEQVPYFTQNWENGDCTSEIPWTLSNGDRTFGSGNALASLKRQSVRQSPVRVACTKNDSVTSAETIELFEITKTDEQREGAKGNEQTSVAMNSKQTAVARDREQTAVAMNSEQTAVARDREQTAVAMNSEQTAVAKDREQTAVARNSEQTAVTMNSKQTELIQNGRYDTSATKQTDPAEVNEHLQHKTNNEDSTPTQRHQNSSEKKPRPKTVSFQTHPTMPASAPDEASHSATTQNDLDHHHHHHRPYNNDNPAASLANNDITHSHSHRFASTEASYSASGYTQGRRRAIRRRSAQEEGGSSRGDEEERMIVGMRRTLVGVSVVFCVTTFPISLFLSIRLIQGDRLHEELFAALNILMYSNNAVNFILYCFTSSTFRAEMAAMGQELVTKCRSIRRRPRRSLPHGPSRSQGFWSSSVSRWRPRSLSNSRSSRSYSFTTTSTQQTSDTSLSSSMISSCSLTSSVTSRYSVTASRPST